MTSAGSVNSRFRVFQVGSLNGQADRVVLDLAGLTFLDITGARALVAAVHAVPDGHPITLRSISPIARRLLGILGWSLGHVEVPEHTP